MTGIIKHYCGLKKEIYVLTFGQFVTAMGAFIWPMLTFLLKSKIGFTDSQTSFYIAAATLVSFPVSIIGGKCADRFNRKYLINIFDILSAVLFILSALFEVNYFTAVMLLFGALFQAFEAPSYDSLIADFSSSGDRERASSFYYLGYNLGYIFSASMAGFLFINHMKLCFVLSGLSILLSTVIIFFKVDMNNRIFETEIKAENYGIYEVPCDESIPSMKILLDRKAVLFYLMIISYAMNLGGTSSLLLPLQLSDSMGDFGASLYGYMNSLNGFICVTGIPVLGFMLKKYSEILKTSMSVLMYAAGMIIYSFNGSPFLMFLGMFMFTLGECLNVLGTKPYLTKRIPASHRGRISGIKYVLMSVVSAGMQFIVGIILDITDSDYMLTWVVLIAVLAVSLLLLSIVYRMDREKYPLLYKECVR